NNIVLKKSFYGCSNYPECKFTLAEHFRKGYRQENADLQR
ncbi:TPA: topoisomerase DNA-binding C4 zinc finger domain-containing protein, partial [Enterococcus faecalis]|nr:topoisomerase DNA-binding C4 zinc finger domain-containing protein [Enterococcus faecalis]